MNDADDWERTIRNDPRSTADLISAALTAADEDAAWDIICVLQHRGTGEVLDATRRLCASECPRERELAADILGQSRVRDKTQHEESVRLLIGLLETEQDLDVVWSALCAVGHRGDPLAIPAVLRWKDHPDPEIRLGVVFALVGLTDVSAVNALIELSGDQDTDVRDWATFELGSQIDIDTPSIRDALVRRLTDADETVRGEAIVGLARRKDERVLPLLLEELERDEVSDLALDAAAETGDPSLLPALLRLKERTQDAPGIWLQSALDRCGGMSWGG